ncbi:thioredoxin domain-containing protein [Rhodoferax sp.]|uniref:thioredoxin domain-containing protein n=1 Tax=Rhodoferax sp. TaxID=50421 RepID=UPI00284163F9|nr:thioredoxin domain-containing protein [Rhodoferax sp.]MDR3369514.1 thioredoxin domain-containing protein [Rhodoferax sp.]
MTKRLATEPSIYLQQHADQPVDWYPWGPEALALARRLDKPILLSIGYAACHWCHVMARESFSDAATAALINEGFVAIKVDREERPDLDAVYQMAHQLLRRTGGGWPLTIFLSPQGMPFYSGTYFPSEAPQGQATFKGVLGSVSTVWSEQRPALARQDQALRAAFAASLPQVDDKAVLDAAVSTQACQQLCAAFDAKYGGFGAAPKFPHPSDLAFLLQRGAQEGDTQARDMALFTLRKMAEGGVVDQIGGGFFRYSVDAQWQIPHFEKMLCDNGVLLALYADALALTGEPLFRRVVEDTADWALREMRADSGGFHASLAADDGQGREGYFYVWQLDALRLALSPFEWDTCAAHWGLVDAPNFEGPSWHLRVARSAEKLAATLDRPVGLVQEFIDSARAKLLAERDKRDRPARDAKVLTGWTALMVTGLARAASVCQRPDWLQAARAALQFLRSQRWSEDGRSSGRLLALPNQDAFLDDHAFLLQAVLALHQTDPQPDDLPFAESIAQAMLAQFEDRDVGGFFFTRHDAPALIHRIKTGMDAATPSGNGVAAQALLQLSGQVGAPNAIRYQKAAQRCVRVFAGAACADPASYPSFLQAAEAINIIATNA